MEENVANAPIRFFAVSYGRYSDYAEHYILALSPNDALKRYMRSNVPYKSTAQIGTVWYADLDEHGILHKTEELYDVELPGDYIWDLTGNPDVDTIDGDRYKYRCRLCGESRDEGEADRETFLNENRKCASCAALRQIEK